LFSQAQFSLGWGIFYLLCSIVVILMQIFVLTLMIRESDNARCLSNDGCPSGTWCGGNGYSTTAGGAGHSGACFDCYYAQKDTTWAVQHTSPSDLASAKQHCDSHDRFPLKCDYVQEAHEQATGCSLFIIIFVAALVPLPIINDADEVVADNTILIRRLEAMQNQTRQSILYCLAWWVLVLRKWLLPALLVAAAVAQTLTNPMTVQQILLNGLCVTFIMEVDVVLWMYIVPKSQARVVQVLNSDTCSTSYEKGEAQLDRERGVKHFGPFWSQEHYMYGKEPWILSRAYAVSLSILMVATCYVPFSFAQDFGFLRTHTSSLEFPASNEMELCDKVSSVCFSAGASLPCITTARIPLIFWLPL